MPPRRPGGDDAGAGGAGGAGGPAGGAETQDELLARTLGDTLLANLQNTGDGITPPTI